MESVENCRESTPLLCQDFNIFKSSSVQLVNLYKLLAKLVELKDALNERQQQQAIQQLLPLVDAITKLSNGLQLCSKTRCILQHYVVDQKQMEEGEVEQQQPPPQLGRKSRVAILREIHGGLKQVRELLIGLTFECSLPLLMSQVCLSHSHPLSSASSSPSF